MKNEIEEGGHPQLIGENDVAERERERDPVKTAESPRSS